MMHNSLNLKNPAVVHNEITHHPDQVAGHGDLLKDNTAGKVYKPMIEVEHFFYESIADISHQYKKPCIMDIKMGISQHLEDMSEEKKALAVAKCKSSTSFKMGFRICGIKVYSREKREFISWDRFWGRNVSPAEIVPAVSKFFGFTQHRDELINAYVMELSKLIPVMKHQTAFRFVSSSLLFMYEGDAASNDDLSPQMKMIDFANTLRLDSSGRNEIDDGYLMGLENIIKVFAKIKEAPREETQN